MRRRAFLGALGGVAVATPALARPRLYVLDRLRLKDPAGLQSGVRSQILLQAIVAPQLPQWLAIHQVPGKNWEPHFEMLGRHLVEGDGGLPESAGIFELRTYRSTMRSWRIEVFHRAGIRPVLHGCSSTSNHTFLIPFTDLSARERAWSLCKADEEWQWTREGIGRVTEIAIYRRTAASVNAVQYDQRFSQQIKEF